MRLLGETFPKNKRALKTTIGEQAEKVCEEYNEWADAFYCKVDGFALDEAIEEALDLLIAVDNWLDKQPEEDVQKGIERELEKGMERGDYGYGDVETRLFKMSSYNSKKDEMIHEQDRLIRDQRDRIDELKERERLFSELVVYLSGALDAVVEDDELHLRIGSSVKLYDKKLRELGRGIFEVLK